MRATGLASPTEGKAFSINIAKMRCWGLVLARDAIVGRHLDSHERGIMQKKSMHEILVDYDECLGQTERRRKSKAWKLGGRRAQATP